MTDRIDGAADIVQQHVSCDRETALHIARQLHKQWDKPACRLDLKKGDVARYFRERYQDERPEQLPAVSRASHYS